MSSQTVRATGRTPILTVAIQSERDVVVARQRARQIAGLLGLNDRDQARVATSMSEIARNTFQYAGSGQVEFSMELGARPQCLWIQVTDRGPGIRDVDAVLSGEYVSPTGMGLGIAGTRRLMDEFQISSSRETGTRVTFGKHLPAAAKPLDMADLGRISGSLSQPAAAGPEGELQSQNQEILRLLDELRAKDVEIEKRELDFTRLNVELEETNRGVVALYGELDEKALALRHADEMKSRILSHVSHEFRTPVNAVVALTRLLLDRVDGELTAEQEKQVSYIRDAARQLAEIVNDLLDLAKVESGKTEVHNAPIDLAQFIGAVRALMRPLVTRETVSLVFEEPNARLTVYSDESKLGQIVRNLISNALKFTNHGEVRVTTALTEDGNHLLVAVKDTGIGIAPEDQERIFQEFAQVNNPIQRHVKGTGLGLPLSRRLAALLGGTLTVESEVGAGSTFTLSLPVGSTVQPAEADEVGSTVAARTDTVLVVDDEPASRYLVRQLMRGTRFHLVESSGTEAAERARFEQPALIFLDLVMPDRSGFEVLDDLWFDERTRGIPVVIHTSKALTRQDLDRLGGRQLHILPKGGMGRREALVAIRSALGDASLFSSEPEFKDNGGGSE